MDAWNEDFKEPTESERSARRVLSLAIAFINTNHPLSNIVIHREFYPEVSDRTFRKTFSRDRERLAIAGMVLRETKWDENNAWEVDEESSFVKENLLTEQDALALDVMLLPLASDPSYPYSRDLRLALNKIDNSFDGSSVASIPPEARQRNNNITRLEDCMVAGHTATIAYVRANGSEVTRTVAPYGFFFLNGSTYMVAAQTDDEEKPPHTYNLSRVTSVREQLRSSFEVPADFDVRDFILLPFQMGEKTYDATFRMPDESLRHEWISDEGMAAAWAIAEGAVPVEPASLLEEWKRRIEFAAKGFCDASS